MDGAGFESLFTISSDAHARVALVPTVGAASAAMLFSLALPKQEHRG